jgi:hypothetical protein
MTVRISMYFGLLLLAAGEAATPAGAVPPANCGYDPRILDLDQNAFDQDMAGGWRALSARPGCASAAADLIRAYRLRGHANFPSLLLWHEAQLRATAGETAKAIHLMNASRHPPNQAGLDDGWNHYVDATIAFLGNDRAALLAARASLLRMPIIAARNG